MKKRLINSYLSSRVSSIVNKLLRINTKDYNKIQYGKNVLKNNQLPTNFSITLGAAPCNHSCLFCPQSVEKPKKAQWLDLKILKKVLNEIPEENILINLSSYNETITAPNLIPALKLIKKIRPNLKVAMASNGTIFRENVFKELILYGLDHYSFSFDAATKEDYKKMMQVDHFDKAWETLDKLVNLRNEMKSKMKITTHIMGFKGKEADFDNFKKYWIKRVDDVIWRRVSNWGSDDLGLSKTLKQSGFESDYVTPPNRVPCTSIFMHFKLNFDGNYFPCVAAVPAYDKHLVPSLGNAKDISWTDAWNNLSSMRKDHLNGEWDKYECCKSCNVWSMWDDMWFRARKNDKKIFYLKNIDYAK
jgi:MoaA/NifB/PqqE/SkfB family radical SAM enzyme